MTLVVCLIVGLRRRRVCLFATDVRVSASSTGVVMSESLGFGLSLGSCGTAVFSFSRQRRAVCVENQEHMSYEGTPLTAPQASRRKIVPPTPQQSSQSSIDATQRQAEVGGPGKRHVVRRNSKVNIGGLLVIERLLREWSRT